MNFGHVAISVSDLDRSLRFYRKFFGLVPKRRYVHKDKGLVIALLKKNDITLEIFEFKKRRSLPDYRKRLDSDLRTAGVKHFSVETKDPEALYKKFKRAGIRFETPLRTFDDGKDYFFIKDPDGILVEVMQR